MHNTGILRTEKQRNKLPSHFPALRLTVARHMEGYQERMAKTLQREAAKRGESPLDLAQGIGVYPTTVERWFRGERTPQRRHRKELAEHWGLALDAFEFDLEAEEKEIRQQLDRIESMLTRLLDHAGLPVEPIEDEGQEAPEDVVAEMERTANERGGGKAAPNGSRRATG